MYLIFYSKRSISPEVPRITGYDRDGSKMDIEKYSQQGTICLIPESAFGSLKKVFEKKGYKDCGEKDVKIDLKRALKFDEKKNRLLPRMIVFRTSNPGGFKRAFNTFYDKHYTSDDPSCLIILKDTLFNILVIDELKKQADKVEATRIFENDPINKMINNSESDPKMLKLRELYIGDSYIIRYTRALACRATHTDSPVLILGESGTGKDVIARFIAGNSSDYTRSFVTVNCSALPETLLESELFGHEKGSFTGATQLKPGLFESANRGTIFLDEIGDLSPDNQVKILHAVENKEIRHVGSNRSIPVDVRIIAATNRNLDAMMKQGTFRDDLYYRISTLRIFTPPLREHPDDIPKLAKLYWERKKHKGILTEDILDYFRNYPWPGNVRELYSLLNSLVDHYDDVNLTTAHVEGIKKMQRNILFQSTKSEDDDPSMFLKIKSRDVMIQVQNLLRAVKIAIRPFIHSSGAGDYSITEMEKLREFLVLKSEELNNLCLEPSFFKSWDLFKKVTRYRYFLEKAAKENAFSASMIMSAWVTDLQNLDYEINKEIMEILWRKIDM